MSLPTDRYSDFEIEPDIIPYVPAPRRRGRTVFSAVVAALLIGVGALVAGWWLIATRIESEIDATAEQLAAQGGKLTADARQRTGFPFRPTVVLTKPEISMPPGAPGPWSWQADKAEVRVSLFSPRSIEIVADGSSHVQATAFGRPLDLAVDAGIANARFGRDPGRETMAVRLSNVSVAMPGGDVVQLDSATVDLARAHVAPIDERTEAYSARLQLFGLTLPPQAATPMGRKIATLVLETHVLGPLNAPLDTAAFRAWRDTGGVMQMPRLLARFGPLTLAAEGTFALDGDMQPMAAGTGRVQGFAPALDALAASQVIKLNDANTAKQFLAYLARPPTPGAEPELAAPLTIQNGKLLMGPVALMQVPRIDWPGETHAPEAPSAPSAPAPSAPVDEDAPVAAPAPHVDMPDGR
ncbi:MAG TPA: DUF2125 domain-containing protein [Alphaproteobacteria bacterium]|jgi:hypothetical protein|nr:DUF2125 domain-containing protein [Alphaproteobacteria bacterium]